LENGALFLIQCFFCELLLEVALFSMIKIDYML
jgi:hypothetical protein